MGIPRRRFGLCDGSPDQSGTPALTGAPAQ